MHAIASRRLCGSVNDLITDDGWIIIRSVAEVLRSWERQMHYLAHSERPVCPQRGITKEQTSSGKPVSDSSPPSRDDVAESVCETDAH